MTTQTDISRDDKKWDLPDDKDFKHQVYFHLFTQVILGFIIASFLIMGVLTFVDWIKG